MPGVYPLAVGIESLHEDSEQGILSNTLAQEDLNHALEPDKFPDRKYDAIEFEGGPGKPLATYLDKMGDLHQKLAPSLEATASVEAVALELQRKRESPHEKHICLCVHEKRLQATMWKYKGENYKGSHFPACAFTSNTGTCSDERRRERYQIHNQRRQQKLNQ